MDVYVAAAQRAGVRDPEVLARVAYAKRMYGAVYPPDIEAAVLAATRALK